MYARRDLNRASASADAHSAKLFSRFDVIMLDAMNTIFIAKGGKYHMYHEFLRTLDIETSDASLARAFTRERTHFESLAETERRKGHKVEVAEVWARINAGVILEFAKGKINGSAEEIGRQMHHDYLRSPSWFEVHKDMRQFLEIAHGRTLIAVASNHQKGSLPRFISYFKLRELVDMVFTSEKLGFEKPDPRFFNGVTRELSAVVPNLETRRMLMVGNNIINDVSGARQAGITHAVLLDWNNEFRGEKEVQRVSSPLELLRLEFPSR